MKEQTLELIRTYTPWLLAGMGVIWAGLLVVLRKTFATRKDVSALDNKHHNLAARHQALQKTVDELPTHKEIASLNISIETLRGDIKAIRPQLQALQRMSDLLLENELK